MEINIKILTPLWTGGVEAGKCDRIHETSILGSLRWWMEVLVRGMGGNACDPTEQKCSAKNGLCEVCKIFGAEGQKRRFRLDVVQDNTKPDKKDVLSKVELQPYQYKYKDKQGQEKTGTRTPTWHFPKKDDDKPKVGTFILKIQGLHPDFNPEIVGGLIQFIADWSALGARPQMGFGVIQVEGSRIDTQALDDWLKKVEGEHKYPELPSLHNIFLAKIQSRNSNKAFTEEETFNLKYDLRQLFRAEQDIAQQKNQGNKPILKKDKEEALRHFIMGAAPDDKKGNKTEDSRMAAKIKISRPYPDENSKLMRVWGWIPEVAKVPSKDGHEKDLYINGWDREKIVNKIYQHLTDNYTLHKWREMNSDRDKVPPKESSAQSFLHSLLNAEESSNISK